MRCCEGCVKILRLKHKEKVNAEIVKDVLAAIKSRTSSKTLPQTFSELFLNSEEDSSPCRYCWGLFQSESDRVFEDKTDDQIQDRLWPTIQTSLQQRVPEIFLKPDHVSIGIGLTQDLRDFHKMFGNPADAIWNELMLDFIGVDSVSLLPSLMTLLKGCCQVMLTTTVPILKDDSLYQQVDPYKTSLVNKATDFELEVFFDVTQKSAVQTFARRPSKMRRLQRNKKSKGNANIFPNSEQRWTVRVEWKSPPLIYSGKYIKLSRDVCQSPWSVPGQIESAPSTSIHELVGAELKKVHLSADENLIGNGREDTDVRMLGKGRDFLVQVRNPRRWLVDITSEEVQRQINKSADGKVIISDLAIIGRGHAEMAAITKDFHETGALKQKVYGMVVATSRAVPLGLDVELNRLFHPEGSKPPSKQDELRRSEDKTEMGGELQIAKADKEVGSGGLTIIGKPLFMLAQKTPLRVLHRRAAMTRMKGIYELEIVQLTDRIFCCRLLAAGGTYIKEFVHGDFGRSEPSLATFIAEAENKNRGNDTEAEPIFCDLLQLDVLNLKACNLPESNGDKDDD